MDKWIFVFYILVLIFSTNFIKSKIITIPYHQEDCPIDDRVIITENMEWTTNDEGQVILRGSIGVVKPVLDPVSIETKIEVKRRGKWRFFLYQNFYNVCSNFFEEGKPYSFMARQFKQGELDCPFYPQGQVPIKDAIYDDSDVEKFIKLTPNDVGNYRLHAIAMGSVDGKVQEVMCIDILFDVLEVDDD